MRKVTAESHQVVGDGMVRKAVYVTQGDLPGVRTVFMLARAEEPTVQESEHP